MLSTLFLSDRHAFFSNLERISWEFQRFQYLGRISRNLFFCKMVFQGSKLIFKVSKYALLNGYKILAGFRGNFVDFDI